MVSPFRELIFKQLKKKKNEEDRKDFLSSFEDRYDMIIRPKSEEKGVLHITGKKNHKIFDQDFLPSKERLEILKYNYSLTEDILKKIEMMIDQNVIKINNSEFRNPDSGPLE